MWTTWLFLALVVTVQGRAVNINNTWVLPEEGFPVFYRYFRDRISWYEADAVCQFHHANLVTVDTTAQYDAVRAYLKELDISSAVWVGLIRSNPDGDFTWTDYRGLSGDGYWSSAPDSRTAPLCAAADPAGDYRWDARACGGPSVASFICELPVPQWALGSEGCMLKALPALTVLYLPESAAVQLTTDCGLAGVRRVQCTGNVKREDLLKDLSCSEDDSSSTAWSHITGSNLETTAGSLVYEQDGDFVTEENILIDQQEEQKSTVTSTTSQLLKLSTQNEIVTNQNEQNAMFNKIPGLNLIENNHLYINMPNSPFKTDFPSTEYANKLEDERYMHHKLLHDELARLGNFESIFNQATDHFVPPLVMAKAKLSNDMTAMSFEEKLAQEHEDFQLTKHSNDLQFIKKFNTPTTESPEYITTNTVLINVRHPSTNDNKEVLKKLAPKKYFPKESKSIGIKRISLPIADLKKSLDDQILTTPIPFITTTNAELPITDDIILNKTNNDEKDETSIELTVIIREPSNLNDNISEYNFSNDTKIINRNTFEIFNTSELFSYPSEPAAVVTKPNATVISKITHLNDNILKHTNGTDIIATKLLYEVSNTSELHKDSYEHFNVEIKPKNEISTNIIIKNMNMNKSNTHEFDMKNSTKKPIFKDDFKNFNNLATETIFANLTDFFSTNKNIHYNQTNYEFNDMFTASPESGLTEKNTNFNNSSHSNVFVEEPLASEVFVINVTQDEIPNIVINENTTDITSGNMDGNIELHLSSNSSEEEIDDFQSPLLSGADDTEIHKPTRNRRIQTVQNRAKKFNPFRILG